MSLPAGMGRRLLSMLWFTAALGLTGFGDVTELVAMPFYGWLGVAVALLMFIMWRERTRPKVNGFWILLGIVWSVLVILPIRPYLGLVVTLPVALLWIHDSPATPSAMLTWGLLATLFQDFEVWDAAGAETAVFVLLATVGFIGAAQSERERLARRTYAPTGRLWRAARLAAVLLWGLVFLGSREAIRAVNLFTYLGLDLRGVAGKITMLVITLLSIALAAMLFRVRPHKAVDPYAQQRDAKGRRVARVPAAAAKPRRVDFDDGPGERPRAAKSARPATPAAKPARPAAPTHPKGPLRPGEIDFD